MAVNLVFAASTQSVAATKVYFAWILFKANLSVPMGYGGVNQAKSFGVPLISAGLTEDKADVNVRVGWFEALLGRIGFDEWLRRSPAGA